MVENSKVIFVTFNVVVVGRGYAAGKWVQLRLFKNMNLYFIYDYLNFL